MLTITMKSRSPDIDYVDRNRHPHKHPMVRVERDTHIMEDID
jgi:hypothetical protein